jgi:hypothetical protein
MGFRLSGDIGQHVEEKLVVEHAPLAADFPKCRTTGARSQRRFGRALRPFRLAKRTR